MHAHRRRTIFRRRNLVTLTSTCLFLLGTVCGCVVSRAQQSSTPEGGREVVDKIPKHLPIKIKVRKPEKLKDLKNEEWLGELELEVTNTGTKPIYFLDIMLDLPDVFAPNGDNIAYWLKYGRDELISFSEPVRLDDVPIQPGGVAVLSVPANLAETWKRVRAKGILSNPKKIEFFFYFINFGDGTGFVTKDGKPLPERKERSANGTCAGGDSAGEAASVTDPPRSYFPEIASLVTLLRRRALRLWLARGRGGLRRLSAAHLLGVERLLAGERGGRVAELPGGAGVERRRGPLLFRAGGDTP